MIYTEETKAYNSRRYGKPWMAIVTTSLTRDFEFVSWEGQPGFAGEFRFDADPGTLIAYGQKDIRKGRGGVDGYQICMPDGSMPPVNADGLALQLRNMPPEQRWRTVAQRKLDYAAGPRPAEYYAAKRWDAERNELAAKYSAILGVANPVMDALAEALGLVDATAQHPPVIDMSAFGL